MSEPQMTPLAGEPLPVEFCHGGAWHPGVLLGWRHAPDGSCSVRLRFVVGGLRRAAWLPLADVRLPQPGSAPTAEPGPTGRTAAPRPAAGPRTRPERLLAHGERSPGQTQRPLPPAPRPTVAARSEF
jgi:hypothetical protein